MTVSSSLHSSSRAGSLPLVGGNVALDFANTESGRGTDAHQNHLQSAENVVVWLEHAKTLSPDEADRLRAALSAGPDLPAELLAQALELRSAIQDVGAAVGGGGVPPDVALTRLAGLHVSFLRRSVLASLPGACQWRWSVGSAPIEAALGPLALAAVRLFTDGDFHRIKQCGGHACGWLFYDTTKNNRRRWCEMEVCGNRAKQRRLAARRRGA
jgi:predicted RNA-binding Zn ribbon-like protein